ncbi:MAG: WYL domain-containing protein, partial [Chloroflexota bacterium]
MRASRLLSILLMLQTRGRMTAQALADELEVSVRTIYRDADQLAAAGIPIYADRGPAGGYQLLDGYRTRLTGLTQDEAGSLFFAGIPGPAAELGLGAVLATAQLKLLAALPAELRSRAGRIRERFHLDAPAWFAEADAAPHLATVADAVWSQRRVRTRYRRDGEDVERLLEPLGLVLKSGIWYLVAQVADSYDAPRTYRVSRVQDAELLDERFERPPEFNLAEHWSSSIAAYEADVPRLAVTVRIDPRRVWMLAMLCGAAAVQGAIRLEADDPEGWTHLRIEIDWPDEAANRLV